MKSASLPSLRVDPALREAAEAVLQEGETLSSFVEHPSAPRCSSASSRKPSSHAGWPRVTAHKAAGHYIDVKDVLAGLQSQLDEARKS